MLKKIMFLVILLSSVNIALALGFTVNPAEVSVGDTLVIDIDVDSPGILNEVFVYDSLSNEMARILLTCTITGNICYGNQQVNYVIPTGFVEGTYTVDVYFISVNDWMEVNFNVVGLAPSLSPETAGIDVTRTLRVGSGSFSSCSWIKDSQGNNIEQICFCGDPRQTCSNSESRTYDFTLRKPQDYSVPGTYFMTIEERLPAPLYTLSHELAFNVIDPNAVDITLTPTSFFKELGIDLSISISAEAYGTYVYFYEIGIQEPVFVIDLNCGVLGCSGQVSVSVSLPESIFDAGAYQVSVFNSRINVWVNSGFSVTDLVDRTWCSGGDINQDGIVNIVDQNVVQSSFGRSDCSLNNNWCSGADTNQDGIVNIVDLNAVLRNFGRSDCQGPVEQTTVTACDPAADVTNDGTVNAEDLAFLINAITSGNTACGNPGCGDIDFDGDVDNIDFGIVGDNFGKTGCVIDAPPPQDIISAGCGSLNVNQCSFELPLICQVDSNGIKSLVNDCGTCGCASGFQCEADGSCSVPVCGDGTLPGQCSANQQALDSESFYRNPAFCHESLEFVYDCNICGCSEAGDVCLENGKCIAEPSVTEKRLSKYGFVSNIGPGGEVSTNVNTKAFLSSNLEWWEALILVPVTTWTDPSVNCNRPNGAEDGVCAYPLLIYHDETPFDYEPIKIASAIIGSDASYFGPNSKIFDLDGNKLAFTEIVVDSGGSWIGDNIYICDLTNVIETEDVGLIENWCDVGGLQQVASVKISKGSDNFHLSGNKLVVLESSRGVGESFVPSTYYVYDINIGDSVPLGTIGQEIRDLHVKDGFATWIEYGFDSASSENTWKLFVKDLSADNTILVDILITDRQTQLTGIRNPVLTDNHLVYDRNDYKDSGDGFTYVQDIKTLAYDRSRGRSFLIGNSFFAIPARSSVGDRVFFERFYLDLKTFDSGDLSPRKYRSPFQDIDFGSQLNTLNPEISEELYAFAPPYNHYQQKLTLQNSSNNQNSYLYLSLQY